MFIHPSINLEISRERQRALLGERESDRIAKIVLADSPPTQDKPRRRPFLTRPAHRLQRASA
jgi:hypothetical protein